MNQALYAMRDKGTGLIKFGISNNPPNRTVEVAKQFGADVELLGVLQTENACASERFVHNSLEEYRVMGEWFDLPDRVRAYALAFFNPTSATTPRQKKAKSKKVGRAAKEQGLINDEIKTAIRAGIAQQGKTQREFSESLGIHPTQLSKMMAGNNVGTLERWKQVLEAVGLRLTVKVEGAE